VAFKVVPSQEDLVAIEKDAQRVANEFKGLSMKEDSAFMQQESENGNIVIQNFTKKTLTIRDTSILTAPAGSVFGPYNEGAYFKIYKLESVRSVADSARVRHILIGYNDPKTQQPKRNREQARKEADSLLILIKAKMVTFDTLVKTASDDMGSVDKGGDYGWFDENKGFVAPFTNAGIMGIKGNISSVETQFGFHIIEVLDVSKTRHTSYEVAQIFKLIEPSDETNQKIFAEANQFGGVNNTAELFDKGVETQKLVKRVADNIKEGDRQLPGLNQAKDLVRWAYTAKKGEVSIFSFPDKHIVAKLSGIRNKGVLPLEEVKEEVTAKAIREKKAEQFMAEFKNKAGVSNNLDDIAAKMGLELKKVESLPLSGNNVEGLGYDNILVGTAEGTKPGATSKTVAGFSGVFILKVNAVNQAPVPGDFAAQKKQLELSINGRSDYSIMNALKDMADIEDHKSRID
jgi:peptidyl-prolyl cis-trans isomerase D